MTTSPEELRLPLTPAQTRLWTAAQLRPRDPFLTVPFAVDLDGPLDREALGRALAELIRRHPALRTRITRGADGEPVQSVRAAATSGGAGSGRAEAAVASREAASDPAEAASGLPVESGLPSPESVTPAEAAALAEELAAEPFDLDGGPLTRLRLLRLGDTAHRLLVAVHHLVFDGASLALFVSELAALYEAFAKGEPSPLPEPPVAYGDFLAARTAEDLRDRAEHLRYWTGRLAGAPEVLELPVSAPRGPAAGHAGDRRTTLVPPAVVDPLRKLARARRCSLYMVLKAAVDAVLSGYGTTDVLTGMALSGRDSTEAAGVVGYLTRPVVLRSDLSDDPQFGELLGRVRGDLLDALDHPDLPMDEVIDALAVGRDPSHHPLYQVAYTHQPAAPAHRAGELVFRAEELRLPTTKADLAIDTLETDDGGLLALADYRTDLLDGADVELLLARLRTVLERVGADPGLRVSALLRPDEAEVRRSLARWNPPRAAATAEACVHDLVAAQAARTPDAVAVASGPRTWSYGELEERAEELAGRLRALGVGPEVLVGVCVPLSFDLVAAELAVWKAGGACVPLDPALPAFLLRIALDDAGVDTVLADPVAAPLFDRTRVRVLTSDLSDAVPAPTPAPAPASPAAAGPRNAAAVLRTSGTTGEPLPVVLEHRQLASRLAWAARELPADVLESVVPLGVPDAPGAVFELFAPLVRGGRVTLPTGEASGTVYAAPSLLASPDGTGIGAAHVLAAGEPLAPAQVRETYEAGATGVHHVYAAAETGGPALAGPVAPGADGPVPLGLPADATVYVLDGAGEPVPPGRVGELHIGGAAVARGYAGRPGPTAERFRPDPYGAEPGGRLFATGDLARCLPDGRLVFAGRRSERIRVRGVPVATVDVRAALLAHPGVARAEVVVDEEAAGTVAAVVARSGAVLTAGVVRAHLAGTLPRRMLPERLEVLDGLPLLPSGRTDRPALLRAVAEAAGRRAEQAAAGAADRPVNETERLVADVWQRVLGRSVGPETGFFDAGGNSLLLIRLRDRLREALGREVEVVDLFRHSTVRAMAAHFGGAEVPAPRSAPTGSDRGLARQQALRTRARARATRTGERNR
ncbi:condensation domain-containing protein [Streptomyces tritici]|uniref:condensation domain-containing protein n=1 Tax=Streptomyces tritici TaxID=2054410 RepID=UPI003AF0764C